MTWLSDATLDRLRAVHDWPDLTGTRYEALGVLGRGGMGRSCCSARSSASSWGMRPSSTAGAAAGRLLRPEASVP